MKGDFTRSTFRRKNHYAKVLHQQGRVGLDADWNEQADITAYRAQTEARDVIGACGAPKHHAGFKIVASGGDFTIGKGRFYVNGLLCENEETVFSTQQPDLPRPYPLSSGCHLVYLDVWQRHLTALDDPQIREVALGGPDTATRTKVVWQVKTVYVGTAEDAKNIHCPDELPEWAKVTQRSTGKLSARAQPDLQSDKPCIVPAGAGYRRLENQLYRVEIHNAGTLAGQDATFKWSRENGSVATVIDSITATTITVTALRKDSALGFAPGNWIEIIDAANELRGEPGTLVRITAVDDLVLTVDPSTATGFFPSVLDPAAIPKVRRWDSVAAVPVSVPATNNGYIPLEDGVEVKFEPGSYYTGDYWMIPARTDKGTVEWPQVPGSPPSGPEAQRPLGIRHHFCRLAIITVTNTVISHHAFPVVTVIEDCRRLFPPLTELEDACGCCTKTVGHTGEADYRFIQEAIDSLPATGGQICVLAGTYAESVEIAGRHNIVIIGCDERSVLAAGPSKKTGVIGPIIQIRDSTNIRVKNLLFVQQEHSAIQVLRSSYVEIAECKILMVRPDTPQPAIFYQGDDGLIERNLISIFAFSFPHPIFRMTAAAGAPPATGSTNLAGSGHPASGLQLAGGCHRVRVVDNVITNVRGQGITFGHLEVVPLAAPSPAIETNSQMVQAGMVFGKWKNPDDQCEECRPITNQVPKHPSAAAPQPTHEIISPLSLWDIHIERNRIEGAGLDGIGVVGFFDLSTVDQFVRVRGLTILGNKITGCLALPRAPIPASWVDQMGYGGIALADVSELVIHDNLIAGNGRAQPAQPSCGIFVLHGDGIAIERNRILGNGFVPSPAGTALPTPGRRGGIQIVYALAPVAATKSVLTDTPWGLWLINHPGEATGFPALKVHDNIISAPVGPALSVEALGPVSVVGNQLTSGHVNRADQNSVYAPATVSISNLGVSNEQYEQQFFSSFAANLPVFPGKGLDDSRYGERLVNGNVLFANNQCSLDLLEPGAGGFLLTPGLGVIYTSIFVKTLDDIAFQDNQCDCNLGSAEDFVAAHTILNGFSLRATGNRFKESRGQAWYSAITTGHLNTTAHNQSTHCLMVTGGPGTLTQNGPNMIFFPTHCRLAIRDTAAAYAQTRAQS